MNKKIKNATPVDIDGIHFRSKMEARVYSILKENGFYVDYEKKTFDLLSGFYPTVECYDRHYDRKQKSEMFGLSQDKVMAITYTPDFSIEINGILVLLEVKGKENDTYPLKKKMFRRLLESLKEMTGKRFIFIEVHTLRETRSVVEFLKTLNNEETNASDD